MKNNLPQQRQGLKNPLVTEIAQPYVPQNRIKKPAVEYKTHIAEPRWQQIISLIVICIPIFLWIWFYLHVPHN